jgi:hypothetical protein
VASLGRRSPQAGCAGVSGDPGDTDAKGRRSGFSRKPHEREVLADIGRDTAEPYRKRLGRDPVEARECEASGRLR